MIFAVLAIIVLGVGIPALFSSLVWAGLSLDKRKLTLLGAVGVFVPGALTSFTFYGHAGPVPALFMLYVKADGRYWPWTLWMFASGFCMVVLFGLLSYRRSRTAV